MKLHIGKALSRTVRRIQSGKDPMQSGDYAGRAIIFLDVDGVLNCMSTKEKIYIFAGIDPEKVRILKEMTELLDADIILTSSWKSGWDVNKIGQDEFAAALDKALAEQGLVIRDKTYDDGWKRGQGILDWMKDHGPLKKFVILDDEEFDFNETGLTDHWIRTRYYDPSGGLGKQHLEYVREHPEQFEV